MSTPSERLASQIIDRLVAEGLFTEEDAVRLLPKIEQGKMNPEDWRLAVEKTLLRMQEHE